ncbi:Nitrilase and fragile histidine triad fusion protein NitFhit [Hypsibius exemplaris]|uniref:Nitrilase and fragile histidine triad fusion protein NitFhit n=1 Tax=Hypsibius exemplaris TaxID=2072580 RepID=A0A1W0X9A9_HYPEX|nr:Nitrilase and fragile histidine triad fusion protein NitFhit [Hypsibius exemplaris]
MAAPLPHNHTNGAHCEHADMPAYSEEDADKMYPLVAVVQFTATSDKVKNLAMCSGLIRKAKQRGALMAFLPEGFDFLGENAAQSLKQSETLSGPIITAYRALAKELRIWLSLGGFHLLEKEHDKKSHNAHLIIDAEGTVVATYRKAHLCMLRIPGKVDLDERQTSIAGRSILPPVQTPVGKAGLMCCYDLRFPEIASLLTRQGAEILAYPAAFTLQTGIAHWEPLLKARAIENQCYVIAAAQCGRHNEKRISYGHAMIVDPWGSVVAQCQDGPSIALAEINLHRLHDIRVNQPVMSHRRHDLYRLALGPLQLLEPSREVYDFGEYPIQKGSVFFETTFCIAFVNLKPFLPGHILVVPKRRVERFVDLIYEEIADLFHVVQVVQKMLEKKYFATATNISIQDGYDAGQTVRHLHVHVIPRKPSDFEGGHDQLYEELESHEKGKNRRARTQDEMSAEALEYRRLLNPAEN